MVVLRSTPEYVLAYVFLQLRGPSMLPAIAALALHNGGIILTLTGRHAGTFAFRPDAPRGVDRYGDAILPRLYGQFLAFLFHRWEIVIDVYAGETFLGGVTVTGAPGGRTP
jgi:phosphonate transport system permease protein